MFSFTQKHWQLALVFFIPLILLFGIFSGVMYQFYISQIYHLDEQFKDASFNPFEIKKFEINKHNDEKSILTENDWNTLSMKEIDEKLFQNNQDPIGDSSDPFYETSPEKIEEIYKEQFGEKSEDIYVLGSANDIDAIENLPYISQSRFEETQNAIALESFKNIIYIFSILLFAVGILSFFLAQFTLKPIEKNMNDQKNFIANASHELKTPLALMKAEAEVLLDSQTDDITEYKDFAKNVVTDVNNLNDLSDMLLDFSSIKKTNKKDKTCVSSLNKNIISLKQKFETKMKKDNKKFNIVLPKKDIFIRIDALEFQQLVTILLDNACKYSKKKAEIKLFFDETNNNNCNNKTKKNNTIKISLYNEGENISINDLPHIFDRFYRAAKHRNNAGHGLGLSLAKEIVERNNGEIFIKNIEDNEKKGVLVEIILLSE